LYVAEFFFGGNTLEFKWDGASWTSLAMGAAGQQLIGAAVGDARGDGSPHLYFTTGSAPPNNVSYEYTFNGTGFDSTPITTPLAGVSDGTFAIAAADGRNDGVQRITGERRRGARRWSQATVLVGRQRRLRVHPPIAAIAPAIVLNKTDLKHRQNSH